MGNCLEYTEGIAGDGAAILRNGVPMRVSEIIAALNESAQPPAQAEPKPCNEVPPGNGYCDMCAAGRYEKCRYVVPAQAEPKLEKPATVGAFTFNAGVSERLVIEAAQRQYEFSQQPEQIEARQQRLRDFVEALHQPDPSPVHLISEESARAGLQRVREKCGGDTEQQRRDAERRFPMQHGPSIPWSLAEAIYAGYSALFGKKQTLERLAQRGGFSWKEVEVIYGDRTDNYRARKAIDNHLAAIEAEGEA